ncbi:hypothetical protein AVEN_17812-1, partial [Araneus ventricosus]
LNPFKYSSNIDWRSTFNGFIFTSGLRGLISFLSVCLTASTVHEASKTSKESQKKLMRRIVASKEENDGQRALLLLASYDGPPFILSAWGYFYFTKGLVLSFLGVILSYSLLILQF